jgi:hypothetical protein
MEKSLEGVGAMVLSSYFPYIPIFLLCMMKIYMVVLSDYKVPIYRFKYYVCF